MKPTKKVAAKKRPAKKRPAKKRAVVKGSIEHKLLQLYNRIDESYTSPNNVSDKDWVWTLVELIQGLSKHTKLCKEDFDKCNGLWKKYA